MNFGFAAYPGFGGKAAKRRQEDQILRLARIANGVHPGYVNGRRKVPKGKRK